MKHRACAICDSMFCPSKFHPHTKTCSRKCSAKLEYRKHKAAYIKRAMQRNASHPEEHRAARKRCHDARREQYRAMWRIREQRRRAKLAECEGNGVTAAQWAAIVLEQRGRCWWCGRGARLSMDHVEPIARGGKHEAANIVGACARCNSSKRDRKWPIEKGALYGRVWASTGLHASV